MDATVADTVLLKVEEVIKEFTDSERSFSAFDVTKRVRAKEGKVLARHEDIKKIVHEIYDLGNFPDDYSRMLQRVQMSSGEKRIFVYFNINNNVFDYDPTEIKNIPVTDDVGSKPTPDKDSSKSFTKEGRINVPKKLIGEANFVISQKIYLRINQGRVYVCDNGLPLQKFLVVNKDQRIRLSKRILEKMFSQSLDKGVEFAVSGNSISITPVN